jgi:hypothetical protein
MAFVYRERLELPPQHLQFFVRHPRARSTCVGQLAVRCVIPPFRILSASVGPKVVTAAMLDAGHPRLAQGGVKSMLES